MDFKGITWAGNIYQKFEAMCLEVEEAMYQDTVKYVDNQVQKVGTTVKKFYSEVMEDLLPPSCVGPMNIASADLSLNPTDIDKNPIPSVFDSHHDIKKKENEDQVISNVTAEKESSLSGNYDVHSLSPQSPGILVQNKCSESCGAISKKVGVHRRPVGIKRISKNDHPTKDSSRMTSLSGDRRSKFASSDTSSFRVAADDTNVMSSLDLDVSREPGEAVKGNAPIPDTPIESRASDKILSAESVWRNNDDSNCTSLASDDNLSAESVRLKGDSESISPLPTESTVMSVNGVPSSLSGSSIRSKACNLESEIKEVTMSNEGTSMEVGSSNISATSCNAAESLDKEIIMSNEDGLDMEVIKNEEVAEPRLVNFEREKLEESCVMVEEAELHSIPQGTRKHKSYKKKIREALSSKLRSRKDDQCVSQHKDSGQKNNTEMVIPVLAMDSEKQKVAAHDSFDSDWELL